MRHESKCKNLHGHRYVVDVTCAAGELDALGRVIDFAVVKDVFGAWVDSTLDHGVILNIEDHRLIELCEREGWRHFVLPFNPTAETLARVLHAKASDLLGQRVKVTGVRVYETPNCWAEYP